MVFTVAFFRVKSNREIEPYVSALEALVPRSTPSRSVRYSRRLRRILELVESLLDITIACCYEFEQHGLRLKRGLERRDIVKIIVVAHYAARRRTVTAILKIMNGLCEIRHPPAGVNS
jgi:hypothetical protein